MITDEMFLSKSITINLFYLSTFRAFCVNIGFSLLEKDKNIADIARSYIAKCDDLTRIVLKYADENIEKEVLDNNILFSHYTLDCELLTEKLFGLNLYTDITKEMLALTSGFQSNPPQEAIDTLMHVNYTALEMSKEFIAYLKDLFKKQINNEIFSYTYPYLTKKMYENIELYTEFLNQLIEKSYGGPSFILTYEYQVCNAMRSFAMFIRDFLDPARNDLFIKAQSFVVEFENFSKHITHAPMTPELQATMVKEQIILIDRFSEFISSVIASILNKEAYVTVAPILIDDIYRAVNYYRYVIKSF